MLDIYDFEMITAITMSYEEDIYNYAIQTDNAYNQEFIAKVVYKLFQEYSKLNNNRSMLDIIENKEINLKIYNLI